MSEGDIKASDITMGCSFNLHSVDFILDFIPHKYCFFYNSYSF